MPNYPQNLWHGSPPQCINTHWLAAHPRTCLQNLTMFGPDNSSTLTKNAHKTLSNLIYTVIVRFPTRKGEWWVVEAGNGIFEEIWEKQSEKGKNAHRHATRKSFSVVDALHVYGGGEWIGLDVRMRRSQHGERSCSGMRRTSAEGLPVYLAVLRMLHREREICRVDCVSRRIPFLTAKYSLTTWLLSNRGRMCCRLYFVLRYALWRGGGLRAVSFLRNEKFADRGRTRLGLRPAAITVCAS